MSSNPLSYHEGELRIAQDPNHPAHLLPPAMASGSRILDIGCGAGQTLIAAYPGQLTFGVDVDLPALKLGRKWSDNVALTCGQAEALPFADQYFDFVFARVSLAYTDISSSTREIKRVLRPGGQVWMTLHPLSVCWEQARKSTWKGWLFFLYILANGSCLHFFQKQFRLFGRQESFQTERGIRRALERAGFSSVKIERQRNFVVTARL